MVLGLCDRAGGGEGGGVGGGGGWVGRWVDRWVGRTAGQWCGCVSAWVVDKTGEATIYFLDATGAAYQRNVLAGREGMQIRYCEICGVPLTAPTAYLSMRVTCTHLRMHGI